MSPRVAGAIAGLAPAGVTLGWYVGSGGPGAPGLLAIVVVGVSAGWIVGPRIRGRLGADLLAGFSYFLVAYLLQTGLDPLILILDPARLASESSLLEQILGLWLVRIVYLPVWAVLLSPAALAWVLVARALHGRRRRAA